MIVNEVASLSQAANENEATSGARRERASFAPKDREGAAAQGSGEGMALAMLRSGLSFMDAAQSSGVSVKRVMALWTEQCARPR